MLKANKIISDIQKNNLNNNELIKANKIISNLTNNQINNNELIKLKDENATLK